MLLRSTRYRELPRSAAQGTRSHLLRSHLHLEQQSLAKRPERACAFRKSKDLSFPRTPHAGQNAACVPDLHLYFTSWATSKWFGSFFESQPIRPYTSVSHPQPKHRLAKPPSHFCRNIKLVGVVSFLRYRLTSFKQELKNYIVQGSQKQVSVIHY